MSRIHIQIDSDAPKSFWAGPQLTFQKIHTKVGVERLSWVDDNGLELTIFEDETRYDEVKPVLKGNGTREDPYIAKRITAGTVLSNSGGVLIQMLMHSVIRCLC